MKEIVQIQVGGSGNKFGNVFWKAIRQEHKIDEKCKLCKTIYDSNIGVFFNENVVEEKSFRPRAILVDSESGDIDRICGQSHFFDRESIISGQYGCSNFAKGYYNIGPEMMDVVLDRIRNEVEQCDSLQGFQITHSLSKGTGSGVGCLIAEKLAEEYFKANRTSYTLLPNTKTSVNCIDCINAVLSMRSLIYEVEQSFVFDNKGLSQILEKTFNKEKATYEDMNELISLIMSGVTSGSRFPGTLNMSLEKLKHNVISFPRVHFLMSKFSPLSSQNGKIYRAETISDVVKQSFQSNNYFQSCEFKHGRCLSAGLLCRGRVSSRELQQEIEAMKRRNPMNFVNWIPDGIFHSICDVPNNGMRLSSTFIANSTAINERFKEMTNNFSSMYRKKAFFHWYANEGMDEMEMCEAESYTHDLISEYEMGQSWEDNMWEEEEEEGEEEL